MNRRKFESIVQTYGADSERWPHAHRADMLALVDTDPQARAILGAKRHSTACWARWNRPYRTRLKRAFATT